MIGNIILILSLQTVILLAIGLGGLYLYKSKKKKNKVCERVEIEELPEELTQGFGYLKDSEILLTESGVPYLFETYHEALNNMEDIKDASKVVYQKWDMDTKMVFVGDIQNGPAER